MSSIVSGEEVYSQGFWSDSEALSIPDDARRLLTIHADATLRFDKDQLVLNNVKLAGSPAPVKIGSLKASVISGALYAMNSIVSN